ncbi:MAG: AEC family transporter [Oscillospiraceae bacterium]|nr:AEC family transporter [Oscillospiraceae bacterium]
MENLIISVNAVAPMFGVIALGYLAQRMKLIDYASALKINNAAFRVILPCLLFNIIYRTNLAASVKPKLIIFCAAGILIVYALSSLITRAVEKKPEKRGVMIQGMFRSNYVILGMPLASSLTGGGDLGVAAVMTAVAAPLFNVLAVITLEHYRGNRTSIREVLIAIVKNPLIVSAVCGIAALISGVRLPYILDVIVSDVSVMATPLMLFLLGACFRATGVGENRRDLVVTSLFRLIIIPAFCLPAAAFFGFRGIEFITALIIFASPAAVTSFVMAQSMGGDADLAAGIVVATSVVSCVTMFLWTFLCKQFGMF